MKQTPMMKQYNALKVQYPGYLLFYRMGDFYELFNEDALAAHSILGITLTQRRSSKETEGIPMCGVPFHAAEGYIAKLLGAGHKVALCEQTESPEQAKKARGSSALVTRDVMRLYTGGTLTEDNLLPADAPQLLVALTGSGAKLALASLNLAEGTVTHQSLTPLTLAAELAALNPAELLTSSQNAEKLQEILATYAITIADDFTKKSTLIAEHLGEIHTTSTAEETALNTVLNYAHHTQKGKLPPLHILQSEDAVTYLTLDATTRTHLELTENFRGERKGSLLWAIDKTVTNPGARLLRNWLTRPLAHAPSINARLNAIAELRNTLPITHTLREHLKGTTDLARALSRLALRRGNPRDLSSLRNTLRELPPLHQTSSELTAPLIQQHRTKLQGLETLTHTLTKALKEEDLPHLTRDGGFLQSGFNAEFDTLNSLKTNGLQLLQELEQREQTAAGIPLKLKYNKVWGYFLEVTKSHLKSVPEHFIHRQTTTNSTRFSTTELMTLERDLAAAATKTLTKELEIFEDLVKQITAHSTELLEVAEALATLDVLASHALLAAEQNYTRPEMTTGLDLDIQNGRHPVVERTVETFISNNTNLTGGQLWLLTGPNMAGKSTYLRQVALITLLAHTGCFVPADAATIGLTDRIFTRIGAADDLARGQSTFMVEMTETAEILNHATDKSLVILDEIGRGTATYDGMSIAWACVDYLTNTVKARGLFATHYHELTVLAEQIDTLHTYHVAAKEWDNNGQTEIVFLHEVKPGAAPRSYGIHVAELAGLPKQAISKAKQILSGLEKSSSNGSAAVAAELPLFFAKSAAELPQIAAKLPVERKNDEFTHKNNDLQDKILEIELDTLSPRDAQNLLYDLQILASVEKR